MGMNTVIGRILILTFSLLLVLPQGWCCLVIPLSAACNSDQTATCPFCQDDPSLEFSGEASDSETPTELPKCNCVVRHLIQSNSVETTRDDTESLAILPPPDGVRPSSGEIKSIGLAPCSSIHRLHVLKCVWLC